MIEEKIVAEGLGDDSGAYLSGKVSRLKRQGRERGAPGVQGYRIRSWFLTAEPFINQCLDFGAMRRIVKIRLRFGVNVRWQYQSKLVQIYQQSCSLKLIALTYTTHPTGHVIVPIFVLKQVVEVTGGVGGLIIVNQFDLPFNSDDVVVSAVAQVDVHIRFVETQILDVVV